MDLGIISVRYARALLKCADEQKLEDKVYKEMQTLSQSYLEVPQLRFTIDNPHSPKRHKRAAARTGLWRRGIRTDTQVYCYCSA